MLADVYDTIFDILKSEFPTTGAPRYAPVVLGTNEVLDWLYGEQKVHPGKMAISIQSGGSTAKEIAQNILEYEHKIKIRLYATDSSTELSERVVLEFARIVRNIILNHRRMYVLIPCPFDGLSMMSPMHYISAHSDVLGTYITTAGTDMSDQFYETHDETTTLPTITDEALAIQALEMLFSDVANDVAVSGLPDLALTRIQQNIYLNRKPVRFLERVSISDLQPSVEGEDQQLLHNGEFTITAKELVRQPAYGPDGVNQATYQRQYYKKT